MNCRDYRAVVGFTGGFLEDAPYQQVRSTDNKCPGEFKIKGGHEHIYE